MNRKWTPNIENKEYIIEVDYGAFVRDTEESLEEVAYQRDGKLLINGNEIKTWDSELPKEISFEIGGKPAVLRRKGFLLAKKLELFISGVLIKPVD